MRGRCPVCVFLGRRAQHTKCQDQFFASIFRRICRVQSILLARICVKGHLLGCPMRLGKSLAWQQIQKAPVLPAGIILAGLGLNAEWVLQLRLQISKEVWVHMQNMPLLAGLSCQQHLAHLGLLLPGASNLLSQQNVLRCTM